MAMNLKLRLICFYSFFLALGFSLVSQQAFSQATGAASAQSEAKNSYDLGIDFGTIIPSRNGLDELVPGWGFRGSYPTSKGTFEANMFNGIGNGIVYRTIGADFRMDIVVENIYAHVLLGGHMDQYDQASPPESKRFAGGWHYGGGVSQHIGGPLLMRFDFRHRFSPGQVVEITLGFTYRIPAGQSN